MDLKSLQKGFRKFTTPLHFNVQATKKHTALTVIEHLFSLRNSRLQEQPNSLKSGKRVFSYVKHKDSWPAFIGKIVFWVAIVYVYFKYSKKVSLGSLAALLVIKTSYRFIQRDSLLIQDVKLPPPLDGDDPVAVIAKPPTDVTLRVFPTKYEVGQLKQDKDALRALCQEMDIPELTDEHQKKAGQLVEKMKKFLKQAVLDSVEQGRKINNLAQDHIIALLAIEEEAQLSTQDFFPVLDQVFAQVNQTEFLKECGCVEDGTSNQAVYLARLALEMYFNRSIDNHKKQLQSPQLSKLSQDVVWWSVAKACEEKGIELFNTHNYFSFTSLAIHKRKKYQEGVSSTEFAQWAVEKVMKRSFDNWAQVNAALLEIEQIHAFADYNDNVIKDKDLTTIREAFKQHLPEFQADKDVSTLSRMELYTYALYALNHLTQYHVTWQTYFEICHLVAIATKELKRDPQFAEKSFLIAGQLRLLFQEMVPVLKDSAEVHTWVQERLSNINSHLTAGEAPAGEFKINLPYGLSKLPEKLTSAETRKHYMSLCTTCEAIQIPSELNKKQSKGIDVLEALAGMGNCTRGQIVLFSECDTLGGNLAMLAQIAESLEEEDQQKKFKEVAYDYINKGVEALARKTGVHEKVVPIIKLEFAQKAEEQGITLYSLQDLHKDVCGSTNTFSIDHAPMIIQHVQNSVSTVDSSKNFNEFCTNLVPIEQLFMYDEALVTTEVLGKLTQEIKKLIPAYHKDATMPADLGEFYLQALSIMQHIEETTWQKMNEGAYCRGLQIVNRAVEEVAKDNTLLGHLFSGIFQECPKIQMADNTEWIAETGAQIAQNLNFTEIIE